MRTPYQEQAAADLRHHLAWAPRLGGIALLAVGILAPLSGASVYLLLFGLLSGLVYGGFTLIYAKTRNLLFFFLAILALTMPFVTSFDQFFGEHGSTTTAAHYFAAGAYLALAILSSSMLCMLLRRWLLRRLEEEEAREPPVPVDHKPVAPKLD